MKKIITLLCFLTLSGCYLDETATLTQAPVIMLYDGSYGYWYDGIWYAAPPGFVYGRPIYWGPCYHRNISAPPPILRREFRGNVYYRGHGHR